MNQQPIGIDAIAFAVPEGYLDLADLAAARNVPAAKYVEGLGVEQMAVARQEEDPVALAANASRRVLAKASIDPESIGLCIVGTETGVDHSKPIAAYLHRLLGLPPRCRVFETKHACYGGTAGLLTAIDWIASGSARGRSGARSRNTWRTRWPKRSCAAGSPKEPPSAPTRRRVTRSGSPPRRTSRW